MTQLPLNCNPGAALLEPQEGRQLAGQMTGHLSDKVRRKDANASGSAPTAHVVHVGERGAAEFLPVAMAYRSY